MKLRMVPGTVLEVRTIQGQLGLEAMILSFDRFQSSIRRQFPLWAVDAAIEAETVRREDWWRRALLYRKTGR